MNQSRIDADRKYEQLNTNTILYLKTMMEINFLLFILYRKLFRIYRAWDTCDMGSSKQIQFDLDKIKEWENEIPGVLLKIAEWIGFLKTVPIKPRDDFFVDIMEICKDLKDQNKPEIIEAYEQLLKVTEEYKSIVENFEK